MLCIDKGRCVAINRLLVFFREYVARRVEIVELIAIRVEEKEHASLQRLGIIWPVRQYGWVSVRLSNVD